MRVAHHILRAPGAMGFPFRAALCRYLLGKPLADALQLPDSTLFNLLAYCTLLGFRAYMCCARWAPTAGLCRWGRYIS